ncbi:MAG: hypothetical protein ACOX2M_08655 [Fastidiosipilaceae bacterium]
MNRNKTILTGGTLLYIVLGVILLLTGGLTLIPAGYAIIVALAAVGVINIVSYLARPVEENMDSDGFVAGMTSIIISIILLFHISVLEVIIPFLLALLITLNGVRELQNAIDMGRLKSKRSWIVVVVAPV